MRHLRNNRDSRLFRERNLNQPGSFGYIRRGSHHRDMREDLPYYGHPEEHEEWEDLDEERRAREIYYRNLEHDRNLEEEDYDDVYGDYDTYEEEFDDDYLDYDRYEERRRNFPRNVRHF